LAAAGLNVLVNNQIVAHPVEACWVNPIKELGQGGMPWLKQLRDMSVTLWMKQKYRRSIAEWSH
jgi:hypothetical protein